MCHLEEFTVLESLCARCFTICFERSSDMVSEAGLQIHQVCGSTACHPWCLSGSTERKPA